MAGTQLGGNVKGKRLNKNAYIAMMALKDYGFEGGFRITSMYRTPEYNKSIGGVANSDHVHGNACDIGVQPGDDITLVDFIKTPAGKQWLSDFDVYYEDETNKKGVAAHHHFGFRDNVNKSRIANYENYNTIYKSNKMDDGFVSFEGGVNDKTFDYNSKAFDLNLTSKPAFVQDGDVNQGAQYPTDIEGRVLSPPNQGPTQGQTGEMEMDDDGILSPAPRISAQPLPTNDDKKEFDDKLRKDPKRIVKKRQTGSIDIDPESSSDVEIDPNSGEVITENNDGGTNIGQSVDSSNVVAEETIPQLSEEEQQRKVDEERERRNKKIAERESEKEKEEEEKEDGISIDPDTGEVIIEDIGGGTNIGQSVDSSKVISTEPFPTPNKSGNLEQYEGESDEDFKVRNEKYINDLAPEDRIDLEYDDYSNLNDTDNNDINADLIGRNKDPQTGLDDWDRAREGLEKEGKLSKKDWYELNKENKSLPEGTYDLGIDEDGKWTDPEVKPIEVAKNDKAIAVDKSGLVDGSKDYVVPTGEEVMGIESDTEILPDPGTIEGVDIEVPKFKPPREENNNSKENFNNIPVKDDKKLFNYNNQTLPTDLDGNPLGDNELSDDGKDVLEKEKNNRIAQENIDQAVEKEVNALDQKIEEQEKLAGIDYIQGENKAKVIDNSKNIFKEDGTSVIGIEGMQHHEGSKSVVVNGSNVKQEAYVYGPEHPKYVEGTKNIMAKEDVVSFNAKLWMANFDKSKEDFFKSILTQKEREIAEKEGMTSYRARKDQEFRNYEKGIGVLTNNTNLNDLIKNNEAIDYDITDYQASIITQAQKNGKRFEKDLKEKQAAIQVDLEAEITKDLEKSRVVVERMLMREFKQNAFAGRFDDYSDEEVTQWYYNAANAMMRDSQELAAVKYNKNFDEKIKEWAETYLPPKMISEEDYKEIDVLFDDIGFSTLPGKYARNAIDNVWAFAEKGLIDEKTHPDVVTDLKNEFYNHYYEKIATNSEGALNAFAIEDFANNALEMGIEQKYEDLIRTKNRTKDQNAEIKALRWTISFAKEIKSNSGRDVKNKNWEANFRKSFANKMGIETIPFLGFGVQIMESSSMYELSKMDPADLSDSQKAQMDAYALMHQHESMLSDMSMGYRVGSMLADMVPYIGEFILTAGVYTAGRAATKKLLMDGLNRTLLKTAKYASVKKGGKGALKRRVSRGVELTSFLAGTVAQTVANPQQYIKHTIDNMTDEMKFMHTTDGDELINFLDKVERGEDDFGKVEFGSRYVKNTGDDLFTAAWKGVGITWAEFATERLGQSIPMLGKYISRRVLGNPEWIKRATVGHFLNRTGMLRTSKAYKSFKKNASWDGMLGETFEELVNLPLSNLIMGKPLTENLNGQFVGDLLATTGIAQVAFGGMNFAHNMYTGNKPGELRIGYVEYDNYSEFKEDLDAAIKNNTLGDRKVKVTGSFVNFMQTEKSLKESGNITNFDRAQYDKEVADRAKKREIQILNKLSESDRKIVLDLNKQIDNLSDSLRILGYESDINENQIKETQNKINELRGKKGGIIKDVAAEIIKKDIKKAQRMSDKIYGKGKVVISELSTEDQVLEVAYAEVMEQMGYDMKDVVILKEENGYSVVVNGKEIDPTSRKDIDKLVNEHAKSDGFVGVSSGNIFVNMPVASSTGAINVTAHELLHKVLAKSLDENPEIAEAIADALSVEIDRLGGKMVASELQERLALYFDAPKQMQSEEKINLFLDALRTGDITLEQSIASRIGDLISRVFAHMGINVRFSNGSDVVQFLTNFNYQFEKGKVTSQLKKLATIDGKQIELTGNLKKHVRDVKNLIKSRKAQITRYNNKFKKALEEDPKAALEKYAGFKFSKSLPTKEDQNKDELFANSNRALNEAMESIHGIENFNALSVDDQAVEWNKLTKQDKLIIGYQVGLEWQLYTLKHIKLKLTDEAGIRTDDQGQKDYTLRNDLINNITIGVENENGVPFMVNTWNPMKAKLTTHLFGLIPLRIPAAARQIPGFFSIKVSEEKGDKQLAPETKKKEESKGEDIKLYEYPWVTPFNDKTKYPVTAKEIHVAIVELIKAGKIDIASLNSYKDVRGVIPQEIIDMVFRFYGIVPKPGNLTKTDIKNGQLRIEFNYNFVFGNFPQGYNSENKSTGTTNVLMTERPTKKNKLKEPKNVFYEELEVPDIIKDEQGNIVEVKTKAKRPSNLKIQRKIKNPGKSAILDVFGITETKGSADNLYKKADNTSSRIRAVVMETAALFVNQAVVEVESNPSSLISQALNDGKAAFRFSKSLTEDQQVIFETGLPRFAKDIVKTNATTYDEIMASLDKTFKNKTLTDKSKKAIAKEVLKVVKQYKVLELSHRGVGARKVIMPQKLNEFIESYYKNLDEETALFSLLQDFLPKNISHKKNGKTVKTKVNNIGVLFKILERIQKNRTAILNIYNKQISAGVMTKEEAIAKSIKFLKGMLQGASKIADGSIVVENGVLIYVPNDEWNSYVKEYKKSGQKILKDGTIKEGPAPMNRKQFFDNVDDFMANFVEDIQGAEVRSKNGKFLTVGQIEKKYNFKKSYPETSKQALEDPYGDFNGREEQSLEARLEIERIFDAMFADMYSKNGKYDFVDIAMMATTMGSGMKSIMRKAANLKYIANGVMQVAVDKRGSELEYEHMIPQVVMMLKVLSSYINTGKLNKEVWEGYHVAIIPKTMDKVLTELGFRSTMPMFGDRYFNMFTFGDPRLAYLISLDPKDKGTDREFKGKDFVEAGEILTKENLTYNQRMTIGKAYKLSKSLGKPRGISVLDFDDTLATSKSMIRYTTPEGLKGKLNAEQYASTYQDLSELGYKWDFSEFNDVVEGKIAPLFQKALKLQSKFGPKNMFVLTARPAEAAPAIFTFLQANGLNIPLKNITGLANSTAEAKALWIADKAAEGYNDFYFADDAIQNVQAVQNMLDQFDVKSKVQQAKLKLSKSLGVDFNSILEDVTGIDAKKSFGKVKAQQRGRSKGKFRPFVPPGAEDFKGLLYNFMSKGKLGEKHAAFFEKHLLDPYNKAYEKINSSTQRVNNEFYALRKKYKDVVKLLTKNSISKDYSNGDAIRVYLWTKAGYEIPGLSEKDQTKLVEYIEKKKKLKVFALALERITQLPEGYVKPQENWNVGNISSDLHTLTQETSRAEFLSEWKQNVEQIFSEKNINKIEAAFGSNFRSALEDMLYRMEFGTSRPRGLNAMTNAALNFINAGVGTIMFFNGRSAILQTISFVNFINYSDNNLFRFASAYANFPQFIKDFTFLFNSDYLQQRRSGMKQDLNAAEMLESVKKSKNKAAAMIAYILEKGFLPTKMADSFAIALGGAAFYRNRIKSLMKRKGMTKKKAEEQAMVDFRKIAEETQQSSRPDFISQQQASLLGHFILAFGNTPMQYVRLQKKAAMDIIKGRKSAEYDNLAQSNIANLSRILYYGFVQNVIFYSLQTALFALLFDDSEEDEDAKKRNEFKYNRMANGMLDTILRGTGVYGAVASMIKNYMLALVAEDQKGFSMTEANPLVEALNVSPPLGAKARMLVKAQRTYKFNKEKISQMPLTDINNPAWDISAKYVQTITNIPTDRVLNKSKNVQEAMNEANSAWQRVFLMLGWDRWGLGVKDRMREFEGDNDQGLLN